ncbi:MAG TPA: 2-succinyl-5-enolpyruvyl-6-hydroxy-3-cyclohexene-1-carboxylic-acid synthase [Candidatus Aphodovivens avistercoris]|nr:2-succinyl-5-enolpyruvyl-6-hydroxy-3-cyclohexene-1-carboxylic-acid synthase [Candidatus Aphodovivens avistercoris]
MAKEATQGQKTALWTAAFLDELVRCGVRAVVVSPGSRSTPLAMAAFELNRRRPDELRLFIDVDERGAAFFGLGMAKATGRPVALVCTSGTATANYYPAVIEAETSRVPLIALTCDRPPRLQSLGAPQTTDQLHLFGTHVRAFRQMPLPGAEAHDVAFARQAAREAFLAAVGGRPRFAPGVPLAGCFAEGARDDAPVGNPLVASCGSDALAGPVQVNFPFDEPLKPDFPGGDAWAADAFGAGDAFCAGRAGASDDTPAGESWALPTCSGVEPAALERLCTLLRGKRVLVLAGEGTCSTLAEAREVASWAERLQLPLLADPLSGLRCVDSPAVMDAYDNVFGSDACPLPGAVIRFGRYPVSKRATTRLAAARPLNVVVDAGETRDFNTATDVFVPLAPLDFVRSFTAKDYGAAAASPAAGVRELFFRAWAQDNAAARQRIAQAVAAAPADEAPFEGAIVAAVLDEAPPASCLFVANSMAVRALDTVQSRGAAPLCVLANRGQNGIDGTVSTALGAAQQFAQTTFVTGDLTLLHDLNALALQNELMRNQPGTPPTVVIVLLNNDGGAIFDMLPQASDEPYFERVFLTPQNVDFAHAAQAFHVPYRAASSVEEFREAYRKRLCMPGISLIEVRVPLRGVKERYRGCWS